MADVTQARPLNGDELATITRKQKRGTSAVGTDADLSRLKVAYRRQGPFTIAVLKYDFKFGGTGLLVGVSKQSHMDVDDPEVGRKIAFARAVAFE